MLNLCPEWFHKAIGYDSVPRTKRDLAKLADSVGDLNITDSANFTPKQPLVTLDDISAIGEVASALKAKIDALVESTHPNPKFDGEYSGWYVWAGNGWQISLPPENETMVFDTETYNDGGIWKPGCLIGVTVDSKCYLWVSPHLFGDSAPPTVIPMGSGNTLIGHNVSYDRKYLDSEYDLGRPKNTFLDTMSMVNVCRGLSNQQRPAYNQKVPSSWISEATKSSLAECYKHYTGQKLDKSTREDILNEGIQTKNLISVLTYCYNDVLATKTVLSHCWYEWKLVKPNDFSLIGATIVGSEILPLSENWLEYVQTSEKLYNDALATISNSLWELANQTLELGDINVYTHCLDWTPLKSGKNKNLPKWFAELAAKYHKGQHLSPHTRTCTLLLNLTYDNQPVTWDVESKSWHYGENPVPHPDVPDQRVTDMFIKGFMGLYDSGFITSSKGDASQILESMNTTINWKSLRERVFSVYTVRKGTLMTLPEATCNGTITGRKTDKLWVVSPNPKKNRIGTELKAMIEAPKGYKIVSFDIDSEELRLFALLGDVESGMVGFSPLSASTLAGSKSQGNDPHSLIGKSVGVPRDKAKTLVYGSIYGLGRKGAVDTLIKEIPGISYQDAVAKVDTFQSSLKGNYFKGMLFGGLGSNSFNAINKRLEGGTTTSILGSKLPFSLRDTSDFKTTRFNWVIQASGRDFLDLFLSLANLTIERQKLDARVILTIHDECHILVKESDVSKVVDLVFHCHAVCWAYVCDKLELDAIPLSLLYPESVSVDTVIRKSPYLDCVTPSHPSPIEPGLEIKYQDWLSN